jgi:hypothetical protein
LKIRRESISVFICLFFSVSGRGVTCHFSVDERINLLAEIEKKMLDGKWEDKELAVMFALLPYPSMCREPSEELLLTNVVDSFLVFVGRFKKRIKYDFFGCDKSFEIEMLNWLFVFFNKYENLVIKEKLL